MARPNHHIPAWTAAAVSTALIVILPLLVAGCGSSPTRSQIALGPLESDLKITFTEPYVSQSEADFQLMLSLITTRIYGCCNNVVHTSVWRSDRDIYAEVGGIYFPHICLTDFGPATCYHTIRLTTGDYRLHIRSRLGHDVYALSIGREAISVRQTDSAFTHTPDTLYWRRPDHSFAVMCDATTETSWMCSDLIDSLSAAVGIAEFSFGDGGVCPYAGYSRGHDYGHDYEVPARYFMLRPGSTFEAVGEALRRFKVNVIKEQMGIGIRLISWDGRQFCSWLM